MNVINSYRFKDSLSRNYFTFKVKTDNSGYTNSTSFFLPMNYSVVYNVDWGDGNGWQNGVTGTLTHDFGTPGVYTVRIEGDLYMTYSGQIGSDIQKIISIENWGTGKWQSLKRMFMFSNNIDFIATDIPDLSECNQMDAMFSNSLVSPVNIDMSLWDVKNITIMSGMFNSTSLSTQNYDALLIAWSELPLQQNVTFGAGNSEYSAGAAATARQKIIDDFNWTITDGGQV